MHLCPECQTRTMVRHVGDNKVIFRCPCGYVVEGRGRDRLVRVAATSTTSEEDTYATRLRNVAHTRIGLRVEAECEKCGLPYMTQVRLGQEETIIRTCKCGNIVRISN